MSLYTDATDLIADGILGQAYFDLATLYHIKKRDVLAFENINKAIPIFEKIGAYEYLKQAINTLASLESQPT